MNLDAPLSSVQIADRSSISSDDWVKDSKGSPNNWGYYDKPMMEHELPPLPVPNLLLVPSCPLDQYPMKRVQSMTSSPTSSPSVTVSLANKHEQNDDILHTSSGYSQSNRLVCPGSNLKRRRLTSSVSVSRRNAFYASML